MNNDHDRTDINALTINLINASQAGHVATPPPQIYSIICLEKLYDKIKF